MLTLAQAPNAVFKRGLKAAHRASTDSKDRKRRQELERELLEIIERPKMPLIAESNRNFSPFFSKLPPEIRDMVYDSYYDGAVLTIREVCTHLEVRYAAFTNEIGSLDLSPCVGRHHWHRANKGLLSLPLTCRQMYEYTNRRSFGSRSLADE